MTRNLPVFKQAFWNRCYTTCGTDHPESNTEWCRLPLKISIYVIMSATFAKLASAEALAAADNWLVEQEGSALAAS